LGYRVRLAERVRVQRHHAPPQRQGFVGGIIACLRVDPQAPAWRSRSSWEGLPDDRGRGRAWFLDDEVFEDQQLVVIDEPTWLES
jgi:hypothetical protein